MNTSDYTRAERTIINNAFNALESALGRMSSGSSYWSQMADAVDSERKGHCPTFARALVLREFQRGYTDCTLPAAGLSGLRSGVMLAFITGAAVGLCARNGMQRCQLDAELHALIAAADVSQNAASQRAFERGQNTSARHGVR